MKVTEGLLSLEFTPEMALLIARELGEAVGPDGCVGRLRLSLEKDEAIADYICCRTNGPTLYFEPLGERFTSFG